MTMTNAEARIRSIIERILRLKDDQDALGADIREIYKEAAGEGFNKTALGSVVTLVRKRAKDGDKLAALEADVALYLAAYDCTPIAPTRMRATAPAAPLPAEPRKSAPTPAPEPVSTRPAALSESVTPNTSAAIPGGAESRPSTPSPDAVPPADAGTPSGQSGQALTPIPVQSHIIREPAPAPVEIPDLPAHLDRRQKASAGC
jgi:uncharacterized protein (UPF0335 family)